MIKTYLPLLLLLRSVHSFTTQTKMKVRDAATVTATSLRTRLFYVNKDDDEASSSSSSSSYVSSTFLDVPHVRWHSLNSMSSSSSLSHQKQHHSWALQTAVTRWQHPKYPDYICELHAMVHYGAFDYYQYYNTLSNQSTTVLFELFLSDSHQINAQRQLVQPVQATLYDRNWVQQYNHKLTPVTATTTTRPQTPEFMHCQVDVLQYQQPHWYHADWTPEEVQTYFSSQSISDSKQPLWKRTQTNSWSGVAQAALVQGGPPLSFKRHERRLFTHLFWPGSSLAGFLRTVLWCTVPSPELSVLLLDMSTLFPDISSSPSSSSSSSSSSSWTLKSMRLGMTPLPIVQALLSCQWSQVQWFLMGQEIVQQQQQQLLQSSSSSSSTTTLAGQNQQDWIQQRNQKALHVLDYHIEQQHLLNKCQENPSSHTFALLYGCQHMPDLQHQLRKQGWKPLSTQWRTAWTIHVPQSFAIPQYITALCLAMMYLSIGAIDWLDVWTNDLSWTAWGLYVARHVLLYVGVSRLFLHWSNEY